MFFQVELGYKKVCLQYIFTKSFLPRQVESEFWQGGVYERLSTWILDILVRIRIRGSVPLTNGSGFGSDSGSCYFRRWQLKIVLFFSNFDYFLLFEAAFTSIFKDKKS